MAIFNSYVCLPEDTFDGRALVSVSSPSSLLQSDLTLTLTNEFEYFQINTKQKKD